MIMLPPGPVIIMDPAQPLAITQRAVVVTKPAGVWESSYFPNYYEFGYTASPTATVPDSGPVNVVSVDSTSIPVPSPLHVLLDISAHDPAAALYLMVRANLQSGFTSTWSAPVLVNDPSAYTPPNPIPTPIRVPTPTATATPPPSPSPTPAPVACPKLQFVGVRGSGETASDFGGYGKTVGTIKDTIEKKVPQTASTAIEYPAIPVGYGALYYGIAYENSVAKGRTVLDTLITKFITDCPKTYLILAGYSQGAQVAGDEFAYLTPIEKNPHSGAHYDRRSSLQSKPAAGRSRQLRQKPLGNLPAHRPGNARNRPSVYS